MTLNTPRNTAIAAAAMFLVGAVFSIQAFLRFEVTVLVNDEPPQPRVVWGRTVGNGLASAGIELDAADEVIPDLGTSLQDGLPIRVWRAAPVEIEILGARLEVFSSERIPANLLQSVGLPLFAGDQVWANGNLVDANALLPLAEFTSLEVRPATRFRVSGGDSVNVLAMAGPTLAQALEQAEFELYAADSLSPAADTLISENMIVQLGIGREVEIQVGDEIVRTRTAGSTVGEALASAGLSLQGMDRSIPAEDAAIPVDGLIEVVRVHETVTLEQQLVPFGTLLQPLPDVPIDTLQIVQAGEYGLQAQRVRVRYENGEEVERTVEDEWVVKEPLPRIEGYGTQISIQTLDTPDGTISYWRAVQFYATSYSPANSGTPLDAPWYGQVYCGGAMQNGFVGVDLDYVPCGTPLYIPGYGFAVAMDTGAIQGAWIDLGYLDADYQPWHQYVTVYFLAPAPNPSDIAWIIPPGSTR